MTVCNDLRRPKTVTCACGTVVAVKPKGRIPWQCGACAHARHVAMRHGEVAPLKPPHANLSIPDERELGPEHPLNGMSSEEYERWKMRRAVRLYQDEPELSVQAIAERLGMAVTYVRSLLNMAGIRCRGDGRAQLASGPPL